MTDTVDTNERKELILKILDGKSKHRLRDYYLRNNYNDVYNKIIEYCKDISDLLFVQKLWHWVYQKHDKFLCIHCEKEHTTFHKNWLDGYRNFCSAKCAANHETTKQNRVNTCRLIYNCDNVAQNEYIKNKTEQTNISVWGFKSTFQNSIVRQTWSNNLMKNKGVEHIFQLEEVKEKSKETMKLKYGKEHYTQTDEYKNFMILYNKENPDEYKNRTIKTKITNNELYGTDWYFNSDDYKMKLETFLEYNNIDYIQQLCRTKETYKETKFDDMKKVLLKRNIDLLHSEDNNYYMIDLNCSCNEPFCINKTTYRARNRNKHIICIHCNTLNSSQESQEEIKLRKFLIDLNVEFEIKNKTILENKFELDIFIILKMLAFEYNGDYWHSELYKDKYYHQNKSIECENSGIDLLHIFEYNWLNKQDIIKSIIINKLNLNENIIIFNDLRIVNNQDAELFLENNSLGEYKTLNNIGLYYNDELVSLLSFIIKNNEIEILSFIDKIFFKVENSYQILFDYLINNFIFTKIISYTDFSIDNGEIFKNLGFEKKELSEPTFKKVKENIIWNSGYYKWEYIK